MSGMSTEKSRYFQNGGAAVCATAAQRCRKSQDTFSSMPESTLASRKGDNTPIVWLAARVGQSGRCTVLTATLPGRTPKAKPKNDGLSHDKPPTWLSVGRDVCSNARVKSIL